MDLWNKFLLIFLILDNDIVIHIPQVHILIIEICTNSGNIKRNLFPCTEFCIGQNIRIEEKNEKIRNFIFVTIILTIILGIIVNLISGFLF